MGACTKAYRVEVMQYQEAMVLPEWDMSTFLGSGRECKDAQIHLCIFPATSSYCESFQERLCNGEIKFIPKKRDYGCSLKAICCFCWTQAKNKSQKSVGKTGDNVVLQTGSNTFYYHICV